MSLKGHTRPSGVGPQPPGAGPQPETGAEGSVEEIMTRPVCSIRSTDWLTDAERELLTLQVSALPVVNGHGRLCGVIGRTELLQAGRVRVVEGARGSLLALPQARVADFMQTTVEVVSPGTALSVAARRMVQHRYNRLFVVEDSQLLGVLSASDFMQLVGQRELPTPLREVMTHSIVSVQASDSLQTAVDRLAATGHEGLLVCDNTWPVGIFTQGQALAAREAPPALTVDGWMDTRILCLPAGAPCGHAARQAGTADVRHIVATDDDAPCGLVAPLDFAKLFAA